MASSSSPDAPSTRSSPGSDPAISPPLRQPAGLGEGPSCASPRPLPAVRGCVASAGPAVLVECCSRDRRLHSGRDLLLRPRHQATAPRPGEYSDLPAVPQHDPVDADAGIQAVHGVLRPGRTVEAPAARDLRHLRRRHRGLRGGARRVSPPSGRGRRPREPDHSPQVPGGVGFVLATLHSR